MPLLKGSSKKVVSQNISEFRTGPSYAHTLRKFGSKKAKAQSIAVALSTARKYARKAEGGADLEDPRMKAIGIRPVEGTPNAPEQPVQAPPEQGSWGPPVVAPAPQPAMSEDDLTKAYLKGLTGSETGEAATPFKKVISGLPQGMVDWVKSPGEMMKGPEQVQHATPGMETEEEAFLQNLNNQNYDRQMTDFGAGTAVGMIGGSKFFGTPENAVGIGGGKLNQPQPITHPKPDSHGNPVVIKDQTYPSLAGSWTDPKQTATFAVGLPKEFVPPEINGIPFQSWKPPSDWVEHFDQNPVHVEEPAFQPDKYKKPASGVVILEPDGRVWLTAPTNQFGGYNASFPKGKMEGGLSMAENAVKEAYEETGLKVKIQGFLTDVDKDTSRTRYYIATRESGTPTDMGWESQGLHVANIHDVGKYLNKPADMQVIDALKNWAKEKAPQKPSAEPQPATKNVPDVNGKYFGKYFHPYDLNPEDVKKFTFHKSNHETGGSNPGGVYHAPDGTPVYIKQFEGDHAIERTYNEKLANELLKLAGVPVANVRMTQLKGHPAIASDMVPGKELNTVSPTKYANLKDLRSHYPAHLWTGNYDFVGTGKNNIMVMPDGQTIHIDPGGALRYRAQGKLKGPDMWGPNVEHFKMTPGKDLTDVMGEHYNNKQMMGPSAKRVAAITDQQIHDLVQQYGPLQKGEKAKLEETLKARRDGVAKLYEDNGSASAPPISEPPKSPSLFGSVSNAIKNKLAPLKVAAKNLTPVEEAQRHSDKMSAKFLLKSHKNNVEGIAKELWDIASEVGHKTADGIVKHLPHEMYPELDQHLDFISTQQGVDPWKPQHEHTQYAMGDDTRPPEGPEGWSHANDDHYGDIKFKPGPHFWDNAPVHDEVLHGKASPADIGRLFDKATNGQPSPFRKIDLATWQPPYAHQIERPKFQNITPEQAKELGVSTEMLLAKGVKSQAKVNHPEFITDPKNKNSGYLSEHALYFFPKDKFHPTDSYGSYEAKPYVMAGKNVWEGYYPRLRGQRGQPSGGSSYSDPVFINIIKAAHERKIDALILHGVSDLGAGNQTQILVLNVHGTLRATNAQFKNMKSNKPMDAILAAGSIPVFYEAMKKMSGGDNKDDKMARGGKVKFKPFSSIEKLTGLDEGYRHTPYKKTVGAGKKAMRTAKHYARGGAAEPEPKPHEFINFAKGGMINSHIPGRTDKIPMKVATGAYVLPADIPSALGQGNTVAGKSILDMMFNSGPYGLPLGKGKPQKFQMPRLKGFAEGGETDETPIVAAGGEYIINPDEVMRQGNGSMTAGHKVLDAFVLHTRKKHIETLKGLKGPK